MQRTLIVTVLVTVFAFAAHGQTSQTPPPPDSDTISTPRTPFEVAQDLAARGRLDKALDQLDKLSTQTPEPAGVERLRGIIFYQKEKFPEAVEAFTKAAEQDPDDRESGDPERGMGQHVPAHLREDPAHLPDRSCVLARHRARTRAV